MKLYKKNLKNAAALTLTLAAAVSSVQAQETATIRLNGQPLATSVQPIVRNGSTLVPMRDIFEALGATVVWNNRTQAIKAQKGSTDIWLQIGNRTARVNGDETILGQVPILYQQSTLVPLRFVSEALGAEVNWNAARRVVRINTDGRVPGRNSGRNPGRNNGRDNDFGEEVRSSITIPAGAVIPVTLDSTLSSKEARVGDTFSATVKSENIGDSEFPTGTKLFGRITEVQPLANDNPGVLGLEFTAAQLPDNSRVPLRGDLISLDDDSVIQTGGRIMAKNSDGSKDKTKIIGIGAGAGFILGKVLGKNSLITGILGAAGGYLYSKNRDKGKEQEAIVNQGSTLGVKLSQSVSYDDAGYSRERAPYLQ